MRCLSLSGLRTAKKTGIFMLGTPTIMTVDPYRNKGALNSGIKTKTSKHQDQFFIPLTMQYYKKYSL